MRKRVLLFCLLILLVVPVAAQQINECPPQTNYENKGIASFQLGDYVNMRIAADCLIEVEGETSSAFLLRGIAHELLENQAQAAADFVRYAELIESNRARADEPFEIGSSLSLEMVQGQVYELPFEAQAGETFDIVAEDLTRAVDPLIVVIAPDGTPVAANDDRVLSEDFNSQIDGFEAETDGTYTLLVTHAGGGSEGTVEVTIAEAA